MNAGEIVAVVIGGIVFLILLSIFLLLPKKVYFSAMFSGAYVSMFKLIGMKMRKINLEEIVGAYILAKKSHIGLGMYDFEIVITSGGHPKKIVEGLIAGKNAKLEIDFEFAKAVDISGMDILQVVRECINPKVVEIPLISSVAQDKREVNVKISLTLKTVLANFLRGVTEETISARAVEAVVTKISNTERASFLVAKPQLLDKAIFDAQIDEDSKYELVSADVIHIDLGNDRGLAAEKEQIEKNRMISANQLEHRRLMAVAVEQEMKAKAEEKKLQIIENEAEIPKAIVEAIKEGKMKDVVDYYKLQNLQADTEMRRRFVGKPSNKTDFE